MLPYITARLLFPKRSILTNQADSVPSFSQAIRGNPSADFSTGTKRLIGCGVITIVLAVHTQATRQAFNAGGDTAYLFPLLYNFYTFSRNYLVKTGIFLSLGYPSWRRTKYAILMV
jgi:hypothetical protein